MEAAVHDCHEHMEAAVHDCREHLRFVTEGFTVLAAMAILGWNDKDHFPKVEKSTACTAQELLESVAEHIMQQLVLVDYRDPETILHFHLNHRTNYTHIPFSLIAQQSGLVSKQMAQTIQPNRFANSIRWSRAQCVSGLCYGTIQRSGQASYDQQVHFFSGIGTYKPVNTQTDIATMVCELKEEALFENQPGRYHWIPYAALQNFALSKLHKLNGVKLRS